MRTTLSVRFVTALAACGPYPTQEEEQARSLRTVAAFEHDCPPEQVVVQSLVLESSARGMSRAVVQVCGVARKYRDTGDRRTWLWTEVRSCPAAAAVEK